MSLIKIKHIVILVTFFVLTFNAVHAQIKNDINLIFKHNPFIPVSEEVDSTDTGNELTLPTRLPDVAHLTIEFYQSFISTQDIPSCIFTPSCSNFAEQSIQKFGLIKGVLLASDRLQRCHNFFNNTEWYTFSFRMKGYIDPVEKYVGHE